MEITFKKKFAQFLAEKRAAKGLTYEEWSVYIYGDNKKKNYLNLLENGKGSPNLNSLYFICKKLNTELIFKEY